MYNMAHQLWCFMIFTTNTKTSLSVWNVLIIGIGTLERWYLKKKRSFSKTTNSGKQQHFWRHIFAMKILKGLEVPVVPADQRRIVTPNMVFTVYIYGICTLYTFCFTRAAHPRHHTRYTHIYSCTYNIYKIPIKLILINHSVICDRAWVRVVLKNSI